MELLKNFKSLADLGSFLSSASSTLTLHNFSFRKELMNAPKNQEIAHALDEDVVIFPKLQQSPISEPIQNISPGLPKELPLKQKTQGTTRDQRLALIQEVLRMSRGDGEGAQSGEW